MCIRRWFPVVRTTESAESTSEREVTIRVETSFVDVSRSIPL